MIIFAVVGTLTMGALLLAMEPLERWTLRKPKIPRDQARRGVR